MMTTKITSLLDVLKEGWAYPYRSKKAHYFKDGKSLCSKHTIAEDFGGLLPTSAFFYRDEFCNKCLSKFKGGG